jgi:putative transcriptional regulator
MHHHPPEEILAQYAAGTSEEAEALLVATHLALCPRCRLVCEGFEHLGGALLLREVEPAEPGADMLAAVLGRLEEPEPPREPIPPAGPNDAPMPLRALTGPLDAVPYRNTGPGIWRFDLPQSSKERPVALVSLRPGLAIPPHRHSGTERGLVLRGGFTDELGHFVRGDVSIRYPDDPGDHHQRIDDGERCVVLMVDDGPKVPTTLWGQAVNFLFGL